MDQFVTKSYAKGGKKMPMVNGKKYSYTKQGMAAAKKAAAKQKPSKTVRKPGMMNKNPRMKKGM